MHNTDMALFSPRKLHLADSRSPSIRGSARKRSLFPSVSPQSDDLGVIMELGSSSDDSASVYSPPLLSPCSSVGFSPLKEHHIRASDSSPNFRIDNILKSSNYLSSPQNSQKKTFYGKENQDSYVKPSHKKSLTKPILDSKSFDEYFMTVESPLKENYLRGQIEIKSSDNFTTPKKATKAYNERNAVIRRSPRSASKTDDSAVIKPTSFYGNMAPILATNQTNRIQGMKCVFRPPQPSKAKAKLLFEDKPKKKRARSKSLDATREAKRRKAVYTGVHHAIPKPVKDSPVQLQLKKESIRSKAQKITDLSRTPYGMKKNKNDGWEYTLRFTKPMRYEDTLDRKRKFFKTSLQEQPSLTSPLILNKAPAIPLPKKRKLFDSRMSYLKGKSPKKLKIALDIEQLVKDFQDDNSQSDTPELQDILLRLDEEEYEEELKKKESDKRLLMKMLEDSPNKTAEIDSLSNCTASLDLNEFSGSSSRDSAENSSDCNSTPLHFFPIFNSAGKTPKTEGGKNHFSTGKKKWLGMGENQLQIDAGQLAFGPKQCAGCGMIYQAGEPEDEMQHSTFHHSLNTLKHPGWKNENIVGRIGQDYVIMVTEDDPKSWQQKAQDIIALVDKSLGITNSGTPTVMHKMKVFLYISERRIVGCMVTQHTTRGYKMMSSESDVDLVSEDAYPVRCGVSRVWTLYSQRRKGVATRLLDAVRRNFMYGCILSTDDIAFSVPTPDGKRFATKYMETPHFYVYYSH